MLTIRLKRVGRKHQPGFRVIVTPLGLGGPKGKPVEYLGWTDPFSKKYELNRERISYWLSKGAKPSPTLQNLLIKDGLVKSKKVSLHKKSKKKEKEAK